MSLYQTQEFLELQKQWYQKLKDEGFIDIENTSSPEEYLKCWNSRYFNLKSRRDKIEATQRYFELARQFHNSHTFQDEKEKLMWALHAEGKTFRKIAAAIGASVWRVHTTIRALVPVMLGSIVDE